MHRFSFLIVMLLASGFVSGQSYYQNNAYTTTYINGTRVVVIVQGAKVQVCANLSGACTQTPVYTSSALSTEIPQPIALDGSGNFGFWIGSGTYSFRVLNAQGIQIQAYPFTVGGSGGSCSGCIYSTPTLTQSIQQPTGSQFYTNIINGVYQANQFQTPPSTGNNGIANAITAGGSMVEADSSYASTEVIPGETSSGYGGNVYSPIPNWPTFTHVHDLRSGRQVNLFAEGGSAQYAPTWQDSRYYFNTYQVTGPTLSFSGFSDQCNFEGTGQQINGFGGVNLKSYWTCKVLNDISTTQGQNLMHISNEQCNGVGDCINQTRNTYSSGGTNAYTDEGTHDHDVLVEEQHGVPVGTVTAVTATTVKATISAGFGTEGQGRYLGNTNAAKVISGTPPTAYTLGNPTFPPSPTIWGINGPVPPMGQFVGTSFTPSTLIMGCTTAFGGSCPNSASVNPSGQLKSASGAYAPGSLTVQVVSQAPGLPNAYGTNSTGFSPGDTVCVADQEYMEETTVTAVPDSSDITINFTKPHFNGFTIAKGGMCGYGVEVTGSTTTIGGVTYRQVWPVVGTLDSTDLLVWDHNSQQNWSHSMLIGGNATCQTATVGNFSNVGAVITMQDAANIALFRNKTGVTVTSANGTYNGTFDLTSGTGYYGGPNVANLSYTASGTPSGAVPTTGTITFCNAGFNLYPIAEVLDVLNPSTHAVDGYFKVGVNNGSFAAGDTVAEFHWPAQQIEAGGESVYQELPMQPYNGFALEGIAAGDNLTGGWALWELNNKTDVSKYQGYGGSLSTTAVAQHVKGLFGDVFQFDNAPDNTLLEVLACKPSPIGCTNKSLSRFNIYVNDAVANQFIADNTALGSIDIGNFLRVAAGGGGSGAFGMSMYSPLYGVMAFSQDQVGVGSLTPDATIEAENYQFWSSATPPTGFQHVSMYGDSSTSIGMQFLAADVSHTTYQGGTLNLGGIQFYHPGTTTSVKTAGISVNATTGQIFMDDATPGDAGASVFLKNLNISGTCTGCGGGGGSITFPQTVSGTTTSGGIPYFSNTTTLSSSGLLTQYGVVYGGGAGASPASTAADTNTAHALFATATAPAFRAITVADIPALPLSCQPGVGDGLNAIPAGTYLSTTCRNETGQTWTLTAIRCVADSGSSTCNATNGAGTALLTGAITGTSTYANGTQSGTTTIASGDYLKITFVADGTTKQIGIDVAGTY